MSNNLKTYTVKVKNVPGLVLPKLGEQLSSGYDVISTSDPEIIGEEIAPGVWRRIDYIQYKTNLYIEPIDIQEENVEVSDSIFDIFREAKQVMFDESNKIINTTYLQCFIYPRSSISKYNLMLKNGTGIVDCSFRNEILLRFHYCFQPEDVVFLDPQKHPSFGIRINYDKIYKKGDKCAQLIFSDISPRINFEIVDELNKTERSGGFGSTGV